MAKLRACKACGAQIAKSAKHCPQCGAKQHSVGRIIGIILIIIAILMLLSFCHSAMNGDSAETAKPVDGSVKTTPEATPAIYGVGDALEMKGIRTTLTAVRTFYGSQFLTPEDGNEFVVFEFEIENHSEKEIAVSSLLCFSAYADDYKLELSLSAMSQDKGQQLDGTIAAGKKMKGVVGFEVAEGWETAEVHFKPGAWSGSEFVFTVKHPN